MYDFKLNKTNELDSFQYKSLVIFNFETNFNFFLKILNGFKAQLSVKLVLFKNEYSVFIKSKIKLHN